jgi:Stigma-specific protein, Stig1
MLDAGPDARAEAGSDGGPDASPLIPCDVDAQADAQTCPGPATVACCAGYCVNTAADPRNCGHCGVACTGHQFCTGTQCDEAVLANLCGNPSATIVLDQYTADNQGAGAIGTALMANCVPPTNIAYRYEDAGGEGGAVTDPATGRPNTGVGNTFITGGGGYGHVGVAYLDMMALTPLFPSVITNGTEYQVIKRATGTAVLDVPYSSLTATHDYFYVELVVEPQSGTLVISGVGTLAPGTVAAGYYLSATIIPNLTNYPNSWYLFEWTDMNSDSTPNAGDTFTQIATGN